MTAETRKVQKTFTYRRTSTAIFVWGLRRNGMLWTKKFPRDPFVLGDGKELESDLSREVHLPFDNFDATNVCQSMVKSARLNQCKDSKIDINVRPRSPKSITLSDTPKNGRPSSRLTPSFRYAKPNKYDRQ